MSLHAKGLPLSGKTLKAGFSGILFATNLDPIRLSKIGSLSFSEADFIFPNAVGINPLSLNTPAGESIRSHEEVGPINFDFFAKNGNLSVIPLYFWFKKIRNMQS